MLGPIVDNSNFIINDAFNSPDNFEVVAHITKKQNTKSILDNGLIPGKNKQTGLTGSDQRNKNVFFWRDILKDDDFVTWSSKTEDVLFLAVPKDKLGITEGQYSYYIPEETVPSSWIIGYIKHN